MSATEKERRWWFGGGSYQTYPKIGLINWNYKMTDRGHFLKISAILGPIFSEGHIIFWATTKVWVSSQRSSAFLSRKSMD